MKELSGHGISGGVAAGKLVTLLSAQTGVPRETSRTPDEERSALHRHSGKGCGSWTHSKKRCVHRPAQRQHRSLKSIK